MMDPYTHRRELEVIFLDLWRKDHESNEMIRRKCKKRKKKASSIRSSFLEVGSEAKYQGGIILS